MPRKAWTSTRSAAEATECAIGYATVVPRGGLTDGKQTLTLCMWAMAVHAVLAAKLVSAIHFSPCPLAWLLSGTTHATLAHLMNTQPTPAAKCGGTMTIAAAFELGFLIGHMCANNFQARSSLNSARAM